MPRTRDEAQVAEAKRLYHRGLDTRAIAAQMGKDPRTVARWLGDEVRRPGPRGRLDVTDQRILDLRDRSATTEGAGPMSFEEIARMVGMSKTGVRMRYYQLTGRQRPDRA
jgi:AsnC-type helix-turn-helix domain